VDDLACKPDKFVSSSDQRAGLSESPDQRRKLADVCGHLLPHSKLVFPQCAPLKIHSLPRLDLLRKAQLSPTPSAGVESPAPFLELPTFGSESNLLIRTAVLPDRSDWHTHQRGTRPQMWTTCGQLNFSGRDCALHFVRTWIHAF
jgi:hypothetical protein